MVADITVGEHTQGLHSVPAYLAALISENQVSCHCPTCWDPAGNLCDCSAVWEMCPLLRQCFGATTMGPPGEDCAACLGGGNGPHINLLKILYESQEPYRTKCNIIKTMSSPQSIMFCYVQYFPSVFCFEQWKDRVSLDPLPLAVWVSVGWLFMGQRSHSGLSEAHIPAHPSWLPQGEGQA